MLTYQNCLLYPLQVFDVQRKVTYKNLSTWYAELREFRPEIPCIVVANKIDGGPSLHLGDSDAWNPSPYVSSPLLGQAAVSNLSSLPSKDVS